MPPSVKAKSIHSTCVAINGRGILLIGKPGTGKSTIALCLLRQGHQLVSDDLTTLTRHGNKLIATCPPRIKNLLLVNPFGLIEVTEHFGKNAVAKNVIIDRIVYLYPFPFKVRIFIPPLTLSSLGEKVRVRGSFSHFDWRLLYLIRKRKK